MLNVHFKKIILLILLVTGMGFQSFSQFKRTPRHQKNLFDLRWFNLGFRMGMNVGFFKMKYYRDVREESLGLKLVSITQKPRPGINLGIITNLKLHDNFDFRFIPSVSLEQRNFEFYLRTLEPPVKDSLEYRKVEAAYMNLPFLIRFKSDYFKGYRIYVQTGPMYSVNMASTKKVANNPKLLKTSSHVFSLVFAFGVDLYGEKIKLSPELRYSLGLTNIYEPKNTAFGTALSSLTAHAIVFSVNFE